MSRFFIALSGLMLVFATVPAPAFAVEHVSRYERDVLQAQKRLIKHRKAKAKAFVKRQRWKANRVSR